MGTGCVELVIFRHTCGGRHSGSGVAHPEFLVLQEMVDAVSFDAGPPGVALPYHRGAGVIVPSSVRRRRTDALGINGMGA